MSNGGVDFSGRCLRCGIYVPTSGGCLTCGIYSGETSNVVIPSIIPSKTVTDTESIEYIRASGEVICESCKKPYYKHPWYMDLVGYDDQLFYVSFVMVELLNYD